MYKLMTFECIHEYLLAVQTAKTICSESKNKNMMRRDIDAPIGKNMAWQVSIVCIPVI